MGFLDRLVGDLIQDSTGIPARRLVRMVGSKNLLMLGAGAAMAGGLAAAMSQQQSSAAAPAAPRAGPPPPPPPPGAPPAAAGPAASGPAASVPPPPPGAATPALGAAPPPPPGATSAPQAAAAADRKEGDAATDELPRELTYAIVRTMVAAALADGDLAAAEKEVIHRRLGESGLSADETRQIHQDLVLPPSPEELASLAPGVETRAVLYRFGALIVLADADVSDLERGWLDRLAAAFELPEDRKTALEAEIFAEDEAGVEAIDDPNEPTRGRTRRQA